MQTNFGDRYVEKIKTKYRLLNIRIYMLYKRKIL